MEGRQLSNWHRLMANKWKVWLLLYTDEWEAEKILENLGWWHFIMGTYVCHRCCTTGLLVLCITGWAFEGRQTWVQIPSVPAECRCTLLWGSLWDGDPDSYLCWGANEILEVKARPSAATLLQNILCLSFLSLTLSVIFVNIISKIRSHMPVEVPNSFKLRKLWEVVLFYNLKLKPLLLINYSSFGFGQY